MTRRFSNLPASVSSPPPSARSVIFRTKIISRLSVHNYNAESRCVLMCEASPSDLGSSIQINRY